MRRVISALLIFMLVLPAFAPWIPHGAMHTLYDSHISAHHGSDHHNHNHEHQQHTQIQHSFNLDFVSYFKDYLHVDLKKPEHAGFDTDKPSVQDFDALPELVIYLKLQELAVIHTRAPPDYQYPQTTHLPVYLSTQRLRI